MGLLKRRFSSVYTTVTMTRIVESQRGQPLFVLEHFKYSKVTRPLASGEIKWRCINRKCTAFLKNVHLHEPIEDQILQRQSVTTVAKRKATEDTCTRPNKIVCSAVNNVPVTEELQVSDIRYVKRNMYNARRTLIPALPKSINEVHKVLEGMEIVTNRNTNFLLINDIHEKIIIFSCDKNLKTLCTSKYIYVDGTFSYCAKFFKQMFTIHGHYIPLIFCLLAGKTTDTYISCLKLVREKCRVINCDFKPIAIISDFEKAIHNTCNFICPNIKIYGCRFHITQAWYRNIQQNGLSVDYNTKDSEISKWLIHCYGLVFLEPENVSEFFTLTLMELKPDDNRVTKFADYLVDTYIGEDSMFPPEMWVSASVETYLTTNACESFHAHFNSSFNSTHLNIYSVISK
ncbi:unnamed protein product [Macrosiphum euphorbiae]|uniref:MULE transposase domain-containing protein n=1 Tax=Macrosiphum euphorbiae TaxID=13131 RepID=A0AAV0W1A1_9HEMI|nr:unnamed protein product [Macrosiphum euphorbiae]